MTELFIGVLWSIGYTTCFLSIIIQTEQFGEKVYFRIKYLDDSDGECGLY